MPENGFVASAVILAAGEGKRAGGQPKQFRDLCGKPLIAHCLKTFQNHGSIGEIIIAAPRSHIARAEKIAEDFGIGKATIVAGGQTRYESARLGFEQTREDGGVAVFHDAARPFVSADAIDAVIAGALSAGAAGAAVALDDSIKTTRAPDGENGGRYFQNAVPRAGVWRVQTPQAFRKTLMKKAYERFSGDPESITDEAALFEAAGFEVAVSPGDRRNMKVTTAEDFIIAEAVAGSVEKRGGAAE